ncbi:hypothetical protein FYJ34_08950 [Clostridiaceae bacterium 68-1-5]|uniref:Uncharacterized protein n=1 Tax=Suipraeoptans intestinalis TaxID=2606628 RepID=A0A6N7V2J2_9FIRM|nr:hypothetical protein [Suipraeoptans intestinalis]MSR94377.1 hypothetical protein [Suipraeoptans intestinalis]
MAMENAVLNENQDFSGIQEGMFNIDELEDQLQSQLEKEFEGMEFLQEEKEKIGNPDALGEVIKNEIWKQFSNQIGLDMTNETLIQKYDREHPEAYDEVAKKVMQDSRYKDANAKMKKQQEEGNLKDTYTGKALKQNDKANLDHVVSRKELYENLRRKQANLSTEDLANKDENLKATNESLNKSKKEKSVNDYLKGREEREKALRDQNERANRKIDESNLSEAEKRARKEKNNKQLQDKLNADTERMKKADKEARTAINKEIAKGVVKEVGKKAGKDALKVIAVTALSDLLREVMNGLVRFLKSQSKSLQHFLDEMQVSLKNFLDKITRAIHTGASSVAGTVLSEIFGPIVSTFKKLASLIKQATSSVMEAIRYLKNEENREKPFSVKIAQVGKIITAGLVAGGAIYLGEIFEKVLLQIPGMQIQLPLLGSLANVIGMFLASLVSGVVGAMAINRIDKFIAEKQRAAIVEAKIEKGNQILNLQHQAQDVSEEKLRQVKMTTAATIKERHTVAADIMQESLENITANCREDKNIENTLDDIDRLLEGLEGNA